MHASVHDRRLLRSLLRRAASLGLSRGAKLRLRWFLHAAEHGNMSQTCRYFGISRGTYLRWASRFDPDNLTMLEEQSRRPRRVRQPETPENVVALIRTYRLSSPRMGKEAIRLMIERKHGITLSASTVGRIIARERFFFGQTPAHRQKSGFQDADTEMPRVSTDQDPPASSPPLSSRTSGLLLLLISAAAWCLAFPTGVQAVGVSQNYSLEGGEGWEVDEVILLQTPDSQTPPSSETASTTTTAGGAPAGGHRGHSTNTDGQSPAPATISPPSLPAPSAAPALQLPGAEQRTPHVRELYPSTSSRQWERAMSATLRTVGRSAAFRHSPETCAAEECTQWFFGAIDTPPARTYVNPLWWLLLGAILGSGPSLFFLWKKARNKDRRSRMQTLLIVIFLAAGALSFDISLYTTVSAASTVPSVRVFNGYLRDSSGSPITTAHTIRFSYWKSADYISTDTAGDGSINTGAANYLSWQEAHTVTPTSTGYFHVDLGSITALPDFSVYSASDLVNFHTQVEVKTSGAADTAYELLDVNTSDSTVERSKALAVNFARNADMVDQREIGTGSGSIPLLSSGGVLAQSAMAAGLTRDAFTIDTDNSASSEVTLRFGQSLAKTLVYDIVGGLFKFNDDVRVSGSLSLNEGGGLNASGSIATNGTLTINSDREAADAVLTFGNATANKTITFSNANQQFEFNAGVRTTGNLSGATLTIDGTTRLRGQAYQFPLQGGSSGNVLRTDGAGNLTWGSATTGNSSGNVLSLHPEYPNAVYFSSGSTIVGEFAIGYDETNRGTYYRWNTSQSDIQDYWVAVSVKVPENFASWDPQAPVELRLRTTSTSSSNNAITFRMLDTAGAAVSLSNNTALTSSSAATWRTATITRSGGTFTRGGYVILLIKMSAMTGNNTDLGYINLNWSTTIP